MIGLNCSTGPEDMRDAIRYLGENAPLPVQCIPNAGLPLQGPTARPSSPGARAARERPQRVRGAYGVGIVGGCCGTTPEHIAAILERVGGRAAAAPRLRATLVSSMMTRPRWCRSRGRRWSASA